jgi:hypothetical protein
MIKRCLIASCARCFNCFLGVDNIDALSVVMYLQQFLKAAWQERNLSQLVRGGQMMLQVTTFLLHTHNYFYFYH